MFLSSATLATTIGILIWLLSYFIPRGIMYPQYDDLGLAAKLISSLLPNMAMTWGFRVISMFEGRGLDVYLINDSTIIIYLQQKRIQQINTTYYCAYV